MINQSDRELFAAGQQAMDRLREMDAARLKHLALLVTFQIEIAKLERKAA